MEIPVNWVLVFCSLSALVGLTLGMGLHSWMQEQSKIKERRTKHLNTLSMVRRFQAYHELKWYRLEAYRIEDDTTISWMVKLGAGSIHLNWIHNTCETGEIVLTSVRPNGAQSPEDWFLIQAQIASLTAEAQRRVSIPIPPCQDSELRHLLPEEFQSEAVQMMMKTGFLDPGSEGYAGIMTSTSHFTRPQLPGNN